MASSSQLPKIKINGSDELESRAQREWGVPQGSPLCVCVCMCTGGGLLTFHSPSSGWVSCTGELPWELRVWEGST